MLLEKTYPQATTCVLFGTAESTASVDFSRYQHVLWCVDSAAARRVPPIGTAVQTLNIEQTPPEAIAPLLETFIRLNPRRLPSLYVGDDVLQRQQETYSRVLAEVNALLESHHRARLTRQKDGFLWQSHVLQNLAAYTQSRVPTSWAGALRGVPAVVCGAGPSLDASAPRLRGLADRVLIFAADSSLRALARHEVTADFAVSTDVAKTPDKCLPPDGAHPPARVVLSPLSPPTWRETQLPARPIFVGGTQLTLDWLAAHGVAQPPLSAADNCGATALELARFLGCAPIYLFGMDLALDSANPGRRHHGAAEQSLYSNSNFNADQEFPTVPGNYAAKVATHIFGDWRALDERLAGWPAGLVQNVTDRGARLRNTTLLAPADFSPPAPPVDKAIHLTGLQAAETVGPPIVQAAFARLQAVATRARDAAPKLRTALHAGGPEAVLPQLRTLMSDPDLGRVLGAYSLKLLPHLVPPTEGDTAFWLTLLEELEQIAHLACSVRA